MEGAVDSSVIRMQDCITASKNASYLPTIKAIHEQYQIDGLKEDLFEKTNEFLDQQYKFDKRFSAAMIYYPITSEEIYYTYNPHAGGSFQEITYFDENIKEDILEIASTLDTETYFANKEGHLYLIRNIMNSSYEPYAVIIMDINQEIMYQEFQSVWGYESMVVYEDDEVLYGNAEIEYDYNKMKYRNEKKPIYDKDENMVWKTIKEEGHDFSYVVKLNEESILSQTDILATIVLIAFITIIIFATLIFTFFKRKVSEPIEKLVVSAKEIEKGNYGYTVQSDITVEEFVFLEKAFNDMSNELKNQFEKIYLEEIALRDAEIKALQSQINPHFLNNTLEIINWEARMEKNYKISGMIEALSTILGETMNRNKRRLVSLAEEMSYVDSYLFIISARLGERFHVNKEIDESLLQSLVPKLIIQPIIENAVKYGGNDQNCEEITIRIYAKEEILFIEIINNGDLSEADRIKIDRLLTDAIDTKDTESTSLGIHNVHKRLQILYGKEYGLTIDNDEKGKTSCKIMVKLDKKEGTEQINANNDNWNH
jgi:two-component system sensor histidine kinase YesM